MARKKKGRSARKAQAAKSKFYEPEYLSKAPHSFIVSRGAVGRNVQELIMDMRQVMAPYTAARLKVRKKNVIKDFVSVAGPLGVTHLIIFSKPADTLNMKLIKLPRGPTLCFKVHKYGLIKDIVSTLKRPAMFAKQFLHHPLLVMNGFTSTVQHEKLITTMFQNMFPSINVTKVKLSKMRRCVLVNFDKEHSTIQFRHYNIRVAPQGIGRGVKKLVKNKVPNLSRYNDVSDFVLKGGNLSESEAEMDGPHNEVTLAQDMSGRGNVKSHQAAIRLTEIGPRFELQLYKIQEGCGTGNTLYHQYVNLTDVQAKAKRRAYEKKKELKLKRKQEQEANVEKKKVEKEEHKQKSLAGIKRKHAEMTGGSAGDVGGPVGGTEQQQEDDDDVAWYRQEVGEEPDEDIMQRRSSSSTKVKRQVRKKKASIVGKTDQNQRKKPRLKDDGKKSTARSKHPPAKTKTKRLKRGVNKNSKSRPKTGKNKTRKPRR